ncbi:glutathione S-transferase [Phyllobacterium sp. 0TCS1.6C]|jgi:glutathione S-transferase|uniref:glutathione S-transferase family protein n=1 Tax=unclassified Phyllobacterium TaxID=2638441 RepID=UPI0022653294|nr:MULTISPECIES: glutathione S-transferase [unclassified Phyllobacterium]MCX8279415.1 glutathione S-transferase [Phyllobacterium sp. 0TCS1.6C]MCX8292394.1 glutathione S-transferase [Phyllobacterium sp. 0TCS1.6A]
MLKIWGRTNSTNVKKVLWTAEEAGLDYENIPAGGTFGIVSDHEYRAKNPNGLVPTLEDGDLTLWESNTIVRYLAARYAPSTLFINDPAERAKAERWMDWTTSTVAAPFRDVFWNVVRYGPDQRDQAALERGLDSCGKILAIADEALASQPYLSGDEFGIGDVPAGCFAYGWFEMPIERPDLPHLAAWYERLKLRPAYQKTVMTPLS